MSDAPYFCRVPTQKERESFIRDFPEFVAPMPAAPASIDCPECGAAPGRGCSDSVGKAGKRRRLCLTPHFARREAARRGRSSVASG